MNAWDHLPNAKLIDQVLSELKANPEVFARARNAALVDYHITWVNVWNNSWNSPASLRSATALLGWREAWKVAEYVIESGNRHAVWCAATTASSSILAFILYDDSSKFLTMTLSQLRMWAELSEEPAATLLLPYIWAREQISPKIYA